MNRSLHPHMILQVSAVWANSDAERQTALISKFLDQLNGGMETEWVDFLLNEFNIIEYSE